MSLKIMNSNMSNKSDELEEGEIADDVPPSPKYKAKQTKKVLPSRYMLTGKKSRTKKKCRHAIKKNSDDKEKNKYKHEKIRTVVKKCPYHIKDSYDKSKLVENRSLLFSNATVKKAPGNNLSIMSRKARIQQLINSNSSSQNVLHDDPRLDQLLRKCSNMEAEMLRLRKENQYLSANLKSATSSCEIVTIEDTDEDCQNEHCDIKEEKLEHVPPDSTTKSVEETEDEDELRRIALSTCLKQTLLEDAKISPNKAQDADDYEVVDMDVDEDYQETLTKANSSGPENDDLFIIDTKPFSLDEQNNNNSKGFCKPETEVSDSTTQADDFEETLLRAHLILSMQKKKSSENAGFGTEECKKITNKTSPKLVVPKINLDNTSKLCKRKVQCSKVIDSNKSKNAIMPQERIIISLNNESSSDESEDEDTAQEKDDQNSGVTLETLISNARQKSDEVTDNINETPKAVACLSKAQQMEYNKLKKLLVQKEHLQVKPNSVQHSNLILLEKNLHKSIVALNSRKKMIKNLTSQIQKKKASHTKSCVLLQRVKMQFQRTKTQLAAAERGEKISMQMLAKVMSEKDTIQNSVSKLKELIPDLQKQCKKLGETVWGDKYLLPAITRLK